jgi:hypothetical protein
MSHGRLLGICVTAGRAESARILVGWSMPRHTYAERAARFDATVKAAKMRSDADEVLSLMLIDPAYDGTEKIVIVAALGDVQSPAGSAAIRRAFAAAMAGLATARPSQRGELRDLACAAVYALSKRDGAAATDIFVTAGFHASQDISRYGLDALVSVGDDRAWDDVMSMLGEILRRKVSAGTHRSDQALAAIEYLARHAGLGTDRAVRLITLVRDRWRNIGDQTWVEEHWPGIEPGGPSPDAVSLN